MLHSYTKPLAVGHKTLEGLFDGSVVVQEKIDGSQISFGIFDGRLIIRSRNSTLSNNPEEPGMFQRAVETVVSLQSLLTEGYTYRGEYLSKPKHNTIKYDRVPDKYIILFDVDKGNQDYMTPEELQAEARRIGLEVVPTYYSLDPNPTLEMLKALLEFKSVLGDVPIEGIVIKNYQQFDGRGKVVMGKMVSEDFKEKHSTSWKNRHPSQGDFVEGLIETYRTEARWRKAIQHLQENGTIEGVPQDIPLLLKEVSQDIFVEYGEEIKEALFKHFWKSISRGVTRGLPEFYKQYLAEQVFKDG